MPFGIYSKLKYYDKYLKDINISQEPHIIYGFSTLEVTSNIINKINNNTQKNNTQKNSSNSSSVFQTAYNTEDNLATAKTGFQLESSANKLAPDILRTLNVADDIPESI